MEKRVKMKLIMLLVLALVLGFFVITVTAQTLSQYRKGCRNWDTSPDGESNSPCFTDRCPRQQCGSSGCRNR